MTHHSNEGPQRPTAESTAIIDGLDRLESLAKHGFANSNLPNGLAAATLIRAAMLAVLGDKGRAISVAAYAVEQLIGEQQ